MKRQIIILWQMASLTRTIDQISTFYRRLFQEEGKTRLEFQLTTQVVYTVDVAWGQYNPERIGIIPYLIREGRIYFVMGKTKLYLGCSDLSDFGGRREPKDISSLDTAIREFKEEAGEVAIDLLRSVSAMSDNSCVIFVQLLGSISDINQHINSQPGEMLSCHLLSQDQLSSLVEGGKVNLSGEEPQPIGLWRRLQGLLSTNQALVRVIGNILDLHALPAEQQAVSQQKLETLSRALQGQLDLRAKLGPLTVVVVYDDYFLFKSRRFPIRNHHNVSSTTYLSGFRATSLEEIISKINLWSENILDNQTLIKALKSARLYSHFQGYLILVRLPIAAPINKINRAKYLRCFRHLNCQNLFPVDKRLLSHH